MIAKVIERYDSDGGEFAEIKKFPGGDFIVSVYGKAFEPITERITTTIEFAQMTVKSKLPQPYTRTLPKGE